MPSTKSYFLSAGVKVFTGIILFIFCFSVLFEANAQQADSLNINRNTDIYRRGDSVDFKHQVDILDVLQIIFKKNFSKNDTVAKQKGKLYLSVVPTIGYTLNTTFLAFLGLNGAIYTDKPDSVNLSASNVGFTLSVKKQIIIPMQTNIWSKKNKYNFLGNWIFYKYPEVTYGLGGHTTFADADPIDYTFLLFRETVLRSVLPDFFLGLGYDLDYHWNITEKGLPDGAPTDFDKYGFSTSSKSSGISYNLLYDTRRNPLNPPRGEYVNLILRTNSTLLGSDKNWSSMLIDLRKYFKLPLSSKNVLAVWSYNWLTLKGTPPYLDLPATSWDTYSNQGRGYVQSRFRGKDLLGLESEYRFHITNNGFLGGTVFVTAQSVSNWPTNNFDTIWPGFGAGIRIKFNKHSNTNLAFDYAFGLEGSGGFFVNLGEVF